jgi:hypothetical protein
MVYRRGFAFVFVPLLACVLCERDSSEDHETDALATSSPGSTTVSCPDVPECNYCPEDATLLCGRPCNDGDAPCNDEQGDGMTCSNGLWICQDAPQREGDCTDLCTAAPSCNEDGCTDGIELQLFSGASFDPGAYEIVIDRDGTESTCTFVISDDVGCELPPCVTDTTCNASYDLSSDLPQITMSFPVSETLSVSVALDGDVRVEVTPPIVYEVVAPNGPGCSPVCGLATLTVDIP